MWGVRVGSEGISPWREGISLWQSSPQEVGREGKRAGARRPGAEKRGNRPCAETSPAFSAEVASSIASVIRHVDT
jgi:hypothetical protein